MKQQAPKPGAEKETIDPKSQREWRQWLQKNHEKKQSIWLIYYKKRTGVSPMTWSDAVEEALCFGWIDSTRVTLDEDRFMQYFTRRKAGSTWSKINKEKVERLAREGLMSPAGLKCIEVAKQNGSWNLLDEIENETIPPDLEKKLKSKPAVQKQFLALSRSVRKLMLYRLKAAKREETRQKRIEEIMAELEVRSKKG